MSEPATPGALDGIRVLDLTTRLAEATGRVFADLGAEVIKIEPPGGCDARFTPPFVDGREGEPEGSLFWRAWGLGKHSVVLDLAADEGRQRLLALARGADVLVESFVPGRLAELGLGPEVLAEVNPTLLVVSVSPYGQRTPDAKSSATDLTLAAAGGLLVMQGDHDRPPIPVGFGETSMHGAVQAAADAILALYERNRSGRGQHLDTSMQAAVVWSLMYVAGYAAFDEDPPTFGDDRGLGGQQRMLEIRPGVRNPVIEPCKDGHVAITFVIGAQGNYGFGQVMKWAAEEEALDEDLRDRDWSTWLEDMANETLAVPDAARGLDQVLAFLKTKTKAEIQQQAVRRKLLIAPAYTAEDLYGDSQLAARDFWQEIDGTLHPGAFAKLSRTPIVYRRAAPALGQDQALVDDVDREPRLHLHEGHSERRGVFDGLKVADFGWIAAGPLITKDLANLGATVLSFESQNRLDTLRFLPPWKGGAPNVNAGHTYANMNQSKFGVACDYSVAESRAVIERAIDWADVVVENYTPGTAARLGFGWERVRAQRPDAVMLSTCMRGQTGPEAKHTGFGLHGAALGGFIAITGWPDRKPQAPWGAYTDFIAPRYALSALGAALVHRDATGEGQYIDISQIEAALHFLEPMLLDCNVNGRVFERPGMFSPRACPHGVFATRGTERYLALAVETPEQWRALQSAVPGLDGDASLSARRSAQAEIDATLTAWCAAQDGPNASQRLRDAGVPAYMVLRARDLRQDPQLVAREFYVELDHAELGRMCFDGAVTQFSATPMRPTHAGPTIGQHTWEVLRDRLGFSEEEIADLAAAGALS
ncbi:MAG: CoA transferase [Deltaproteobacteria bacterium]|nr:CoA transferase [Deltaproteobacteria bacterium]MBW2362618.1 CoA transferase [Deltaproteobacteria bacterium]